MKVLSSGAMCHIGYRGCSQKASQESSRGTGPIQSSKPFDPGYIWNQPIKQNVILDQDDETPTFSSDAQEAVAGILTTTKKKPAPGRYEAQQCQQGCT